MDAISLTTMRGGWEKGNEMEKTEKAKRKIQQNRRRRIESVNAERPVRRSSKKKKRADKLNRRLEKGNEGVRVGELGDDRRTKEMKKKWEKEKENNK